MKRASRGKAQLPSYRDISPRPRLLTTFTILHQQSAAGHRRKVEIVAQGKGQRGRRRDSNGTRQRVHNRTIQRTPDGQGQGSCVVRTIAIIRRGRHHGGRQIDGRKRGIGNQGKGQPLTGQQPIHRHGQHTLGKGQRRGKHTQATLNRGVQGQAAGHGAGHDNGLRRQRAVVAHRHRVGDRLRCHQIGQQCGAPGLRCDGGTPLDGYHQI